MICVDMNISIPKSHTNTIFSRNLKQLRSDPQIFLRELARVEWESFKDMDDIDDMVKLWSNQIIECLDFVAPWKSRKYK